MRPHDCLVMFFQIEQSLLVLQKFTTNCVKGKTPQDPVAYPLISTSFTFKVTTAEHSKQSVPTISTAVGTSKLTVHAIF